VPCPASSLGTAGPTVRSSGSAIDPGDGPKGNQIYGQARHRDPLRCTLRYTAYRDGLTEIVLAALIRFPCAIRQGVARFGCRP
jgi:hypothetical protein